MGEAMTNNPTIDGVLRMRGTAIKTFAYYCFLAVVAIHPFMPSI